MGITNYPFGVALLCVGLLSYGIAIGKGWDELKARTFIQKIGDIISHLPRDDTPALPHVVGGMTFFGGVSLLLARTVEGPLGGKSHTIEVAAFLFGVLIAGIAFWTLWQTRRIDLRLGTEISGFHTFIEVLTRDGRVAWNASYNDGKPTAARHRFLLVTNNPWLGQLTYPGDRVTMEFKTQLIQLAERAKEEFRFEIVCAERAKLFEFNAGYYSSDADGKSKALAATDAVENLIAELNDKAGKTVVHRVGIVPSIQFAVIGNRTYEFFLDNTDGSTDIERVTKIDEAKTASRFTDFFDQLVVHASPNASKPRTNDPASTINPSLVMPLPSV